jgi:cyclopropane fatty-acyl-phospholipid synthase-like methyltransferase
MSAEPTTSSPFALTDHMEVETMPEIPPPSLEAVVAFYDNTTAMEILMGQNIHLGCWPENDGDMSLAEAQDRLTDLVAAQCDLHPRARLLDVGCGTGAPARRLARTTGVSVTGVTLSPRQMEVATARSLQEGLEAFTEFRVADAAALPFADEEFDAAIAIESILHMPEKSRALGEIFRVLRPGAALVIADLTQTPEAVAASTEAVASVLSLAAAPTEDGYRELADRAGFHVEGVLDLGPQIQASYTQLIQRLAAHRAELTAATNAEQAGAIEEVLRLYGAATVEGTAGYILLTARKPAVRRRPEG